MCNILEVADKAEVIVNGYAFTKSGENIRVLNLNRPEKASYLSKDGVVLETSMDDVEIDIVLVFSEKRNNVFMESW